jgi:hypothetical protein
MLNPSRIKILLSAVCVFGILAVANTVNAQSWWQIPEIRSQVQRALATYHVHARSTVRYTKDHCIEFEWMDCSCYAQHLISAVFGIDIGRSTLDQFYNLKDSHLDLTEQVVADNRPILSLFLPGDLIYSRRLTNPDDRHVMIYVGDGVFTHSSSSKGINAVQGDGFWQKTNHVIKHVYRLKEGPTTGPFWGTDFEQQRKDINLARQYARTVLSGLGQAWNKLDAQSYMKWWHPNMQQRFRLKGQMTVRDRKALKQRRREQFANLAWASLEYRITNVDWIGPNRIRVDADYTLLLLSKLGRQQMERAKERYIILVEKEQGPRVIFNYDYLDRN